MPLHDKDAAFLPRRFGKYWALVYRPTASQAALMWIPYSPDLRHGEPTSLFSKPATAMVGCRQNWPIAASHRNQPRLVGSVSRSAADREGIVLSARCRAFRSPHPRALSKPLRRVDCLSRGAVRKIWRRCQYRVSMRLHDWRRRRHHQPLVWRRR